VRTLGNSEKSLPTSIGELDFLSVVERFGRTGYWHIDVASETVFLSDEICRAHAMPPGYRPESIRECIEWYHPEDRDLVKNAVYAAARDGEAFSFEARLVSASKQVRWVSVSGEVKSDDQGNPTSLIGTLSDISVEREMNVRLGRALHDAKIANRLKDTFLANMSHELRTPLNAIIGFSQVIGMMEDQGKVDEQVGGYAADITNAGSHLLAIIEDIFSLAQMEAEAGEMKFAPIHVGELFDDVRSLVGAKARDSKRKVVFECSGHASEIFVANKDKMTKVLVNLVSNALKFSPASAPIRVIASIGPCRRLMMSVVDKGPGIPEHMHEKIFERFERLEATKHAMEGVGVGLAIARDLVSSMGGEIGVSSVEGEGSTFWLAFERAEKAKRAIAV